MLKDDLKETILHMLRDTIHKAVVERFVGEYKEDWDIQGLADFLQDDLKETILHMLRDTIHKAVVERFVGEYKEDWDIQGLADFLHERYGYTINDLNEYKSTSIENYSEKLYNEIVKEYEEKENRIGSDMMRRLEKYILFEVVDSRWREHLKTI